MTVTRHFRAGALLVTAAGLLFAVAGAFPAQAQEEPPPEPEPGTGNVGNERWTGTFADADMAEGLKTVEGSSASGSGTFVYVPTLVSPGIASLEITSTPVVEGQPPCAPDLSVTIAGDTDPSPTMAVVPSPNTTTLDFTYTVSSTCNQILKLNLRAGPNGVGSKPAHMNAVMTFADPPLAVTDFTAELTDKKAREVTIEWSKPEGAHEETTYSVERSLVDSDEWEEVTSEESYVDELEEDGAYQYRVLANRPHANSAYVEEAVATVYVGVSPPTSTTTTEPDDDPDGSTTTITLPDGSDAPIVVQPGTSRTANPGVSTHTTVTVAPRSPVTTIDTGFEETLDYEIDDAEPGELAAEGQSILSSEDAGSGVIGPGAFGAAAMVLVGWAGHYVYFRRLAAQF